MNYPVRMSKFSLFCLAVLILAASTDIIAQSGGGLPKTSEAKANKRPDNPKPSPTPVNVTVTDDQSQAIDEDGETIVVDTQLVTIPVRVLDRKGRFIVGLTRQNFKVFEDNVEQEISLFSNEAQPFTVALVLDMSYSTKFRISDIQSAAIAFIDQLRPADRVIVISFDEEVRVHCEATNDRDVISKAIRSTKIATGTSLYEAVDLTINDRLR